MCNPMNGNMDGYLTLEEAAKLVPGGGRDVATVWRWCRRGLRRGGRVIRLKHVRFGQRLATKAEWVEEFAESLAEADAQPEADDAERPRDPAPLGPSETERRLEAVGL